MLFNKKLIGIWTVCLIFISILLSIQSSVAPSADFVTVVSHNPKNAETDVQLNATISITFNMAINVSTFAASFSISPVLTGDVIWSEDNITVTYTPDYGFTDFTTYTISLDENIKSADGSFSMIGAYAWSFTAAHEEPVEFSFVLGPFINDDNTLVTGAKVTIIVNGLEYSGMTNEVGLVEIMLPNQPIPGQYIVTATKENYEDLSYEIVFDEVGKYSSEQPRMKKETNGSSSGFISGFESLIFVTSILLILGLLYHKKRILP
jgi:hypothetical protein